jgi:hypothetical protein
LDGALERPRPELRVVALLEDQVARFLGQLDLDFPFRRQSAREQARASFSPALSHNNTHSL